MSAVDVRPARPGGRALGMLVLAEARMVARDTAGLVVPFALPLLILVMSASGAAEAVVVGDRTALEVIVLPIVVTTVMAMIGIVNLPSFLAAYRRAGVLRRLAVTPVSPSFVLVAQAIVAAVQAALGIALALVVARFGLGARMPVDWLAALGVALLALAAMCAVGMVVAAIAPTPSGAVAIGLIGFLGIGALGGMFGGQAAVPEPLQAVGAALPFGAAVEAMTLAAAGEPQQAAPPLALGTAVVVGGVVSAALFRWE